MGEGIRLGIGWREGNGWQAFVSGISAISLDFVSLPILTISGILPLVSGSFPNSFPFVSSFLP